MNIIVQMDKDEFDTLQKQANQNVETLRKISLDIAWETLTGLVVELQSPENHDKSKTMGELAEFLLKAKPKFGYVCLNKAMAKMEFVEPFHNIPRSDA